VSTDPEIYTPTDLIIPFEAPVSKGDYMVALALKDEKNNGIPIISGLSITPLGESGEFDWEKVGMYAREGFEFKEPKFRS
jgi:hypothetical protein